jgi:hypothetical protein
MYTLCEHCVFVHCGLRAFGTILEHSYGIQTTAAYDSVSDFSKL